MGLLASSHARAQEVWTDNDIGAVGVAGSSSYNTTTDTFTINGAGTGVSGTSDGCHLVSEPVSGNLEIIAHVGAVQNTSNFATAGLMMRESTAPGAVSAYVAVSPGDGMTFTVRTVTGMVSSTTVATPGSSLTAPIWLRLARSATGGSATLTGYYSTDGASWTLIGTQVMPMASTILMGMAVSSTTTAETATATFDHVDAMVNVPQASASLVAWLRADVGVTLNGGTVSQWADQSGNGNNALQATATKQPAFVSSALNGQPALQFNAAAKTYLAIPNNTALNGAQVTIFAVVKKTSATTAAFVVTKAASAIWPYALELNGSSTATFRLNNAIPTDTGTLANNTFGVEEGVYNETAAQLYVNGTLSKSTAYTKPLVATNTDPVAIGGESAGNSLDGDIAEVLIYNTGLTTPERQQVEAYLYQKYGVGTQPTAPSPALSLGSGIYPAGQTITLTPALAGDILYYTTDGTTPTTSSTEYTVPLTINATTTLQVIEVSPGFINSPVVSAVYTIDAASLFPRTGLVAWLRADVGVTVNGNTVSQWADQSGNANDATQTTAIKQPTLVNGALNGLPVLQFNSANNSYISIPNNSTLNGSQLSVFAVVKKTSATTSAFVVSKATASSWPYALEINGSSTAALRLNSAITTDTGTLANSTYGVEEGIYNQIDAQLYVNGILGQSTAYKTALVSNNTGPVSIGGEAGKVSLDGDIAEVLVYNTGLTTLQRQQVEAYFFQRYGLGTQPTAPVPTFGLAPGTYSSGQMVSLVPALTGDSIYYTTNGTTPTTGSTKYTVPVTINATTTLQAIEVSPGFINSPVVSAVYTIDPTSTFTRAGLVAWLRADVGVTLNGSAVSQWNDQSGNGNNAVQATGTKQPTLVNSALNGEPVLQFTSAANSYLAIPNSSLLNGTQLTVIAVVKKTGATASALVVSKAVSSTWPYALNLNGSSTATLRLNTAATTDTGTLANSTYGVEEGVYNQADAQLYVNGILGQSTAYTKALIATNTDPVSIGGESTGNSLDGDIAEVLIYNTALTTLQRQDVEAYLYEKYGVGTQVPAPSPGLSPAGGIYNSSQTVTLTPAQTGDTLYYTTDGTPPTTGSTEYTVPLTISATTTLQVIEVSPGFLNSAVVSALYTIDPATTFTRTGLVTWLRADVGVTLNGNTVSAWADQSGDGNNATQATATKQPAFVSNGLHGEPVLQFNSAANTFLAIPNNATLNGTQVTVFTVVKKTSSTSTSAFLVTKATGTSWPYALELNGSSTATFRLNSAIRTETGTLANGAYGVEEGIYNQTDAQLYVNGILDESTAYTAPLVTTNTGPVSIGGESAGYSLDGDIAEVLIFNTGLTTAQREQVEAYLYQRYAVGQP